jgi:hypothetical protein
MPPHERHWLMRIDFELNADVDFARFLFFHRAIMRANRKDSPVLEEVLKTFIYLEPKSGQEH